MSADGENDPLVIEQAKNSVRLEVVTSDLQEQKRKTESLFVDISDIKLQLNEIMTKQTLYAGLIVGGLSFVIAVAGMLLRMPM